MENVGGIYVLCLRCHFDQEFRQAQKPTDEGIQVKLARYHVKTFDIEMLQKWYLGVQIIILQTACSVP